MKKKIVVLALAIAVLLSITVLSQAPITNVVSKISQVTPAISLNETEICTTTFYDEIQNTYSSCIFYLNSTSCLNLSGPNTDCSANQSTYNYTCRTGQVINKNSTGCQSSKFRVSIDTGSAIEKKEIDFSNWGVCINSTENGCLAITCGTLKGGSARNGIFNGCDSGKSCQKFLFCQDSIKVLYKASRGGFVEYDPTFHLNSLDIREVGQ